MSPDSSKSSLKFKNALSVTLITLLLGVMLSSNIGQGPFNKTFFNFSSSFNFIFKSQGLAKIVQNNLTGGNGEFSIYITDLIDAENYTLNSSDIYPAASLYKLYLMAAVMKEMDKGELGLDDNVSSNIDHLEEVFGSIDFGYNGDEGDIEYSVEETLERVGRVSDNFAAIMLAEKVGWDKVQKAAYDSGATATTIKSPIFTTASDIANFLKLLYQDKIVSPAASEQIRQFLKLSQLNNRIPAGLPEGIEVVHKTGELSRVRHDAGIVYLGGSERAYVIVLMSKDLKDENEAVETMAKISKEVYEYFSKKYEL